MKPETDWGRRLRVQDMRPTQQTLKMARSDWRGRICHTKIGRDALKTIAPPAPLSSQAAPTLLLHSSHVAPNTALASLPRRSRAAPTPLPRRFHAPLTPRQAAPTPHSRTLNAESSPLQPPAKPLQRPRASYVGPRGSTVVSSPAL